MRFDLPFNEPLARRLPLPLAQLYRQAHNAKNERDHCLTAYYLWEAALKLLAAAAVALYAERNEPEEAATQCLQNLARPSLGHWWEFLRRLTPILADAGDPHFAAVRDLVLGRTRDDLPRTAGLDAVLLGDPEGRAVSRSTVRVSELFDRLVQYRNREIGHGAAGQRPTAFYDRLGRALFAGVPELLERLDVLAGRRLVYVPDVRRQPGGAWLIERYELTGEAAHRIASLQRPETDGALLPRPEYLYLQAAAPGGVDDEAVTLVALHPLAVYDPETTEVLFLNARRGRRRIEYLCYGTGRVAERSDLAGERRALLARVLAMPVDEGTVENWAARSEAGEPAAPSAPGRPLRQLGEFELLSELGHGGMGVVYRAWQPSLGRQVALKKLTHTGDEKAQKRFAREIRALGRVEHPNLVKIFTSGSVGEEWFYAMELLEGAPLSAVCERLQTHTTAADLDWPTWQATLSTVCEESRKQEKPIGDDAPPAAPRPARLSAADGGGLPVMGRSYLRHIVELVRQAAEAAHALHAAGVIHRDIKPGNIMVSADGGQAVLMDLGLAQLADDTQGRLTRTRQFVGTLRYASPEQVLAVGGLDRRSDVYGLGASLWELLTLRPMFNATEETPTPEVMRRIQFDEPERPRKYHPGLPRDLDAIVLKCLEKNPTRRYATAADLAADLRRFLNGEPVRARPVSKAERYWRWCKRNPTRVAAAGLGVLAAVASLALLIGWGFAATLQREKDRTVTALNTAEEQRKAAEEQKRLAERYRGEAERLSAQMTFKKGADLFKADDAGRGILWMARALGVCPDSAPELRRSIRTALPAAAATIHTLEAVFPYPDQTVVTVFSPDGKTLLFGGKGGCLVEVETGRRRGVPLVSDVALSGGAFRSDGKLLVTSDMGGLVRFADASSGEEVGSAVRHSGVVKSVAFSPDGKTVVVAAQFGVSLQCYDVESRRPVGPTFECKDNLYAATYSPDGKTVATAAKENNASLWDVTTGRRIGLPLVHPGVVFAESFSPDGKTLVTGCLDGGVRLWDVASGKRVGAILRHEEKVHSAVFSRDGRLVLSSSEDGTARLWEAATGRLVGQQLSHSSELRNAVFSPDQTHILTAGFEGTARLWRLAPEQALAKVLQQPGAVVAAAFSPDGKQVLTGCWESEERPGESRLWDAVTGAPLGPPMSQQGQVMAVAFSPDGKLALTAGNDGTARLWNTADGTPAQTPWKYEGVAVAAVAFSPDGRLAAIGGRGSTVQLREVATGKIVAVWQVAKSQTWVWSLAFTPDGRRLLTGGKTSRLWSVPDGTPIGRAMEHDNDVKTAVLSPDGQTVLTCSEDMTARLWSAEDGRPLSPPLVHHGEVLGGAFRPDGKVVATASADGTARLWEAPGGRSLTLPLHDDGWVRSVAFSPDGKTLATGCDDGGARLWNADEGVFLGAALQHRGPVNRVAFSPDGKTVLTAGGDGDFAARLWTPRLPVGGAPENVDLWVQVLTGMKLNADDTIQDLSADDWQKCRRQLQDLGGPPRPEP